MEARWIYRNKARSSSHLKWMWPHYDHLKEAMRRQDERVPQMIREAPIEVFYVCGNTNNGKVNSLLDFALGTTTNSGDKLPEKNAISYANLILDRAPWLATGKTLASPIFAATSKPQHTISNEESKRLRRALEMGDAKLALRLWKNGAIVNHQDIQVALNKGCVSFVETLADAINDTQSLITIYLKNPPKELRAKLLEKIDRRIAAIASPKVRSEATYDAVKRVVSHANIRDMVNDFAVHVLYPAAVLAQAPDWHPEKFTALNENDRTSIRDRFVSRTIRCLMHEGKSASEIIEYFEQLSHSWHHPAILFPKDGFDVPEGYEVPSNYELHWHALLPEPFVTSKGYVIKCLTNESELEQESQQLSHCVRGYGRSCCYGSHILSVQTPEGRSLSTVQVNLTDRKSPPELRIVQHQGKGNTVPLQAEQEAFAEFLEAVRKEEVVLNTKQLGETDESKRASNFSPFIKECGYFPTWANVDRAFQEFKKDLRRGSTGVDGHNQLLYADTKTADGYRHAAHLIGGTVKGDRGERLNMRDMNIREWLRAMDMLKVIGVKNLQDFPLSATLLPPPKPGERRLAERYHAGTLEKREVEKLGPVERKAYEQRIAAERKETRRGLFH